MEIDKSVESDKWYFEAKKLWYRALKIVAAITTLMALLMVLGSLLFSDLYGMIIVRNDPEILSTEEFKSLILILTPLITLGFTSIGVISSLLTAWRLDYRQVRALSLSEREAVLKEKEYALKVAELEHKLATLAPTAGAGDKTDPP